MTARCFSFILGAGGVFGKEFWKESDRMIIFNECVLRRRELNAAVDVFQL
jgi:hypothetical protein